MLNREYVESWDSMLSPYLLNALFYSFGKDIYLVEGAQSNTSDVQLREKTKALILQREEGAYVTSRIAWALTRGVWPHGYIQHINGDYTDYSGDNLVELPRYLDARIKRLYALPANNTSNYLGVCRSDPRHDSKSWRAQVTVPNTNEGGAAHTQIRIGSSNNILEAVALRAHAEIQHGYHINHGGPDSEEA